MHPSSKLPVSRISLDTNEHGVPDNWSGEQKSSTIVITEPLAQTLSLVGNTEDIVSSETISKYMTENNTKVIYFCLSYNHYMPQPTDNSTLKTQSRI